MLSDDFKTTVRSHTSGQTRLERVKRASRLCRVYGITDKEDLKEAAAIAEIEVEEMRTRGLPN